MGYYDNPDRIMIGVDVDIHFDLFNENWSNLTGGKEFDWDKDDDAFNEATDDIYYFVEKSVAETLGHQAIEEFHTEEKYGIYEWCCTFWGDRNNPDDIKALEQLQGMADDKWIDNGRVQLAIYGNDIYEKEINSFLDSWGEKGTEYGVMAEALVDAITVGVDFPEEFDSDPMYDKVGGMNIKNSKQIKSAAQSDYDKGADYAEEMYLKYVEGGINAEDIAAPAGCSDDFWNGFNNKIHDYDIMSSRKPVKSSVEGLTFDNKTNSDYNDFVQYKVNNQKTLDKIKEYLAYDEDELKLGNVYVTLMYDNNELVAAQVVDTESSTWDLSPEECIEIFESIDGYCNDDFYGCLWRK